MVSVDSSPPDLIATNLLGKITDAWFKGVRHIWLEGGTWASKTYSVLQFLKLLAESNPDPLHISIISETMPHLKRGVILDFKDIMGDDWDDRCFNKTDFLYKFSSGSWIEFFSADMPSKVKGGRRDILFANEANHIDRDIFRQADMRTRLLTIADWNPESEFWFHEDNLADDPDDLYIHTTYLDAIEVLPDQQRKDIEKYKDLDPNWWNIYGLGLIGKIEGLVYPYFKQVDKLPGGDYFYGLDFGFAADPTVLVKNVIVGDNLYSQQMFYKDTPMTNDDISREMMLLKVSLSDPIYPDPNEPKSAEEIRRKGFTVEETEKGPGSVKYGIKRANSFFQHWTKDSVDCIKEQRNYRYIRKHDTSGREFLTDDTTHRYSHGMDARRYAIAASRLGSKRARVSTSSWG
ncbi:hypothetical protein LCGC14_0890650 [marine sediment metagenome]|uniref:Phage terminase large subunit N-terminal domain-containing protein n=1 Tax=marine sediment metagenome TaxID=412755 RepID=A0A0F9S6C8_9ZZZZ